MKRRHRTRAAQGLRWLVYLLAVLLLNLPVIVTLLTSLKTDADINASPPIWLFHPTFMHYAEIFSDPTLDFPHYLVNSTSIALGATLLTIALALPAAYAIARLGIGASFLLPAVTNLRVLPLVIFAIPFYLAYQALGLLDTRLGMMIIGCLINLPLALIMLVGFLRELPRELDEAARVDGATLLGILRLVIIPLARPSIMAVAILSFIYAWNEFLFALILTTRHATPVTVGATYFITSWGVRWGATAAAMVVSVLPPLLLGLASHRFLARATTAGAVKG
ncbi:carbohydrate ABC transporter permease [Acidisoma cellulosilytica]|uniref:Carbohydrate ABC transporter permease n=1 Tax=Acidisoma cellulosilyticum TaxID=2802395 RepID=A0A963Z1N0_9PROT|nr:carbohydrate ABC transporter permease [Acidisoma cellulosilyticum]MCB8881110.1 carbohydrate ABC transporter permease [Acidisoma cellulosilyticum]